MTDILTATIAGRVIGVIRPTDGQFETLARIQRTLARGSDDEPNEFWVKQIDRLGTLLENLISEGDRDTVDQLFLTGKIDTVGLMRAIFEAVGAAEAGTKNPVVAEVKANSARVKRK